MIDPNRWKRIAEIPPHAGKLLAIAPMDLSRVAIACENACFIVWESHPIGEHIRWEIKEIAAFQSTSTAEPAK